MTTWAGTECEAIGQPDELEIATSRPDGSLRPFVQIWVVHVGDDLYVRSYRGEGGMWYRHVLQQHGCGRRACAARR